MKAEDFSTESAPLEAGTLAGDVRDALLTHVRSIRVPWAMLAEDEQRDKIEAITNCASDLVRRAIATVAEGGFPSIIVSVGGFKVDKGVEVKLAASGTVENITRLAQHGKGSAVLVLAEAGDYLGERAPAKPDKDQRSLPLDGVG